MNICVYENDGLVPRNVCLITKNVLFEMMKKKLFLLLASLSLTLPKNHNGELVSIPFVFYVYSIWTRPVNAERDF
jgi:hypothetical protein